MHVNCRPAVEGDIEVCLTFLPSGFVCEPALRARLPDVWRQWMREGSINAVVLEDLERPAGQRLIAFGASAFATDAFMCDLRQGSLFPSPAAHAARCHLSGDSPLLGPGAVRRANSGEGLNLLVLYLGWKEAALTEEETRWVKAKMLEVFGAEHAGYRLKEVIQEVYTEGEMRRGLAAGALLRTDYAHFYEAGLPLPHTDRERPFLIGNTREMVEDGSTLAPLFYYTPPRFYFKAWEQDVLRCTLLGHSDAETAAVLHVSASTVQKRWHAIYERVAEVMPLLFPADAMTGYSQPTRGAEKRRHLLAYLRQHPEELRPILAPSPQKGQAGIKPPIPGPAKTKPGGKAAGAG